jgi:hypothetical protein
MLFQAIATGQVHFKRARLLLYTLKIAAINQRALTQSRAADAADALSRPVIDQTSLAASPKAIASPAEAVASVAIASPAGVAAGLSPREEDPTNRRGLSLGPSHHPAPNSHLVHTLPATPENAVFYA